MNEALIVITIFIHGVGGLLNLVNPPKANLWEFLCTSYMNIWWKKTLFIVLFSHASMEDWNKNSEKNVSGKIEKLYFSAVYMNMPDSVQNKRCKKIINTSRTSMQAVR